jgi:hypothetical protein
LSYSAAGDVVQRLWGADPAMAERIIKAASAPATTTTTGWAAPLVTSAVGTFLRSLRPRSAAAQLFTSPLSLEAIGTLQLPRVASDFPEPPFVAEGAPIPAMSGVLASVALGPPKKMALLASITSELDAYSAESAEAIVRDLMDDAAARGLDAAVFSPTAASATRPAGLLNGVTAITETSGGGQAAALKDVQNLIAAINAAGGGSSTAIFANPVQAAALAAYFPGNFPYPIVPTPSIAVGTVIAIETAAIASGFSGLPDIDASKEATIHFEDTTPLAIGTAGSPNTVAAPVRSAFQTDVIILRMILRCAWVPRASGLVQFVEDATW